VEVGRRAIREGEWQTFLHDQVTPCFPEGLTGWDAKGQRRPAGQFREPREREGARGGS